MTALINSEEWAAYRQAINDASDTFAMQLIVWNKVIKRLAYSGDERNPDTITPINLNCLVQYNIFKLWPGNKESPSGELDKTSIAVILNKDYLGGLGYLNSDGNFAFNPETDTFILNGELYYPAGDTPSSQDFNDPMNFYLVMKRTPTPSGKRVY